MWAPTGKTGPLRSQLRSHSRTHARSRSSRAFTSSSPPGTAARGGRVNRTDVQPKRARRFLPKATKLCQIFVKKFGNIWLVFGSPNAGGGRGGSPRLSVHSPRLCADNLQDFDGNSRREFTMVIRCLVGISTVTVISGARSD